MAIGGKVFTAAVTALLALTSLAGGLAGRTSDPAAAAREQGLAAVPAAVAPKGAPTYQVEAELDPDKKLLTGHEQIRWTNTTEKPQSALFLWTQGVNPAWGPVTITAVKVNAAPETFELKQLLVGVPLTTPLAPGEAVNLEISFASKLPDRLDPVTVGNGNITFDGAEYGTHWLHHIVTMADAFPRVLQSPADGSAPPDGPAAHSRVPALYAVSLTAPAGWTVVSSGIETGVETLADGRIRRHLVAGQTTMFSLVAGQDLKRATRVTTAATVHIYYPAAVEAIGQDVADRAAAVMALYADRLGPIFEQEVDLVAVPSSSFLGLDVGGGLIFLAQSYFSDQVVEKEPRWLAEPSLAPLAREDLKARRTALIYHELAHGQWGGVVEANTATAAWTMEGMAEEMMLYALEELDGPAAAETERLRKQCRFQVGLARGEKDGTLRGSYERLMQPGQYSRLFYDKGSLFLDGLRHRIGDEAFFKGLRQVLTKYRGQVLPDDEPVQSILDVAGNTPELEAYVHRWLDETHANEDLGPLPDSAWKLLK